ncbi:hypothetical protein REPUB_Repub11eG0026700 [Reevesia pubescens]
MSKEVGGDEYLGFTKKDCYNYVNQRNMSLIEAGDSQSLINHFKQRQAEDVMFFYTVQVDEQNRMTNFFWRDGRSRIDYDCFGDVIVFDTTYRTNKYNLICAPFVGIVLSWRCSESQENFRCKQGLPPLVVKTSGLLNHAAIVYTCEIFKQFEKQFWNVMATNWTEVASSNDVHTYEIKGEEVGSRKWIVCFNASSMNISCSCKKLESKGFICCHILRVLSINNVTKIPESCILHRWTKDAKNRKSEFSQREVASTDTVETNSMFRNEMMRFAYNIVTRSQDDEVCRQFCRDNFSKLNIEVESWLSTLNVGETSHNAEDRTNFVMGKQKITDTEPILNPECVKRKGISKGRLRGHFQSRTVKANNNLSTAGKFELYIL